MGVTAVLLPLHRDAPSALVIIPVGWPSTLAADRSGFGTSAVPRTSQRRFGGELARERARE